MQDLIYRKNNLFVINKDKLSEKANKIAVINSLYADIYLEFRGAAYNSAYKNLTPKSRMEKVNEFAYNWLKDRNLL